MKKNVILIVNALLEKSNLSAPNFGEYDPLREDEIRTINYVVESEFKLQGKDSILGNELRIMDYIAKMYGRDGGRTKIVFSFYFAALKLTKSEVRAIVETYQNLFDEIQTSLKVGARLQYNELKTELNQIVNDIENRLNSWKEVLQNVE